MNSDLSLGAHEPILEEATPEEQRSRVYANQGVPSEEVEEIIAEPKKFKKIREQYLNSERRFIFNPPTSENKPDQISLSPDETARLGVENSDKSEPQNEFKPASHLFPMESLQETFVEQSNQIKPGSIKGRGGARIPRYWPPENHNRHRDNKTQDPHNCRFEINNDDSFSYYSKETGKELYRDLVDKNFINILTPLEDPESDKAILGALQLAGDINTSNSKDNLGVTGSEEFKARTIKIAAQNGMSIDPTCLSSSLQDFQKEIQFQLNLKNHSNLTMPGWSR